jgi:dihydroneopterin aldolase
MPDQIIIRSLELSAHIGVPDSEREAPQRLTATLCLEPTNDFRELDDSIARTVDYYAVSKAVQALARERPRKLIETLAEEIAMSVLQQFQVRSVELELRKYILPDTEFVAVRVRRERT